MAYIELKDLEVYKNARKISELWWALYKTLSFENKKIIWEQFIRACDSIWANIAEWYGRFGYKDTIKFYYYSRGSIFETKHWLHLMVERKIIEVSISDEMIQVIDLLWFQINKLITSLKKSSED
jgi:four helix bundle protein